MIITGLSDGTVSEVVRGDLEPGDLVVVDVTVSGRSASASPAGGQPPRMGRMF
jgi:hypothetical protein